MYFENRFYMYVKTNEKVSVRFMFVNISNLVENRF